MLARRLMNTAALAVLARAERRVPFWPIERIVRRQERRVRAIVRHAHASVPFYADCMRELRLLPRDIRSADDLSALPLIDSAIVRADPDRFLSSHVPPTRRRELHSSGSHGGTRGVVWWDERSLLRKLAYLERDRAVIGRLLGRNTGHRQLYVLPSASQSLLLRAWWDGWTVTPSRMAVRETANVDEPYEALSARLRRARPDIVYSYGSFAEHYARWLAVRQERVEGPRVWCYGGDGMPPEARALLERQTGALVHTTYQATETGRIGFECERRDGLHLNVDLCAMRLVDADGRPTPPGGEGEVVVSNLHNRATVLLNYRLGDRGALAETACACGRGLPVLRALLGRQAEVVHLADGRALTSLVLEGLCLDALESALRSRIVADAPGRVTWQVVLAPGADFADMTARVRTIIRASFADSLEVTLQSVADLPSTPQGKFVRVAQPGASVMVTP